MKSNKDNNDNYKDNNDNLILLIDIKIIYESP